MSNICVLVLFSKSALPFQKHKELIQGETNKAVLQPQHFVLNPMWGIGRQNEIFYLYWAYAVYVLKRYELHPVDSYSSISWTRQAPF